MATVRSVGVGLGIIVALAALGALLALAVGRVTSSSADTLSLDTVIFSGDNLGLWHDQAGTQPVTSIQFEVADLQPPLGSADRTGTTLYVQNLSTADMFFVEPCGPVFDTTTTAQIGTMDTSVFALNGVSLGNTCARPPQVLLKTGDIVRARVRVDLVDGLVSGDYSFKTTFRADSGPIPPPAGMVSWWPGDGHTGDIVDGNHGTLTGDATFAPGMVGQAFSFDGAGDFVIVPDSSSLNPTEAITVDFWVFVTATQGERDIVSKDGESSDRQYLVSAASSNRFRAHISVVGTATFQNFDGATLVLLNTWCHVAMTYDGATLKLYVNGVLDGSMPVSGPIITTTQPVRIGGGSPPGTNPWYSPGLIDEVEIFNRALSGAEIQSIYDAGSAGKIKP